jgi:nucleoid DNA-binding protein
MNATELITAVCKAEDVDPVVAARVMRSFLESLASALSDGQNVTIRGFGRFETHVRKAMTRRNPATGKEVVVPEHRVLGFHPAPGLKARLNGD